jgi:thymidine kinase
MAATTVAVTKKKAIRTIAPMSHTVVVCGPMFAGKTSCLMQLGKLMALAGYRVVYCRPARDSRSGKDKLTTHVGQEVAALTLTDDNLHEDELASFDVICADELQFLKPESVDRMCDRLVVKERRLLVFAGLDMTYKGERWPATDRAITRAGPQNVLQLTAQCFECGEAAPYTVRVSSEREDVVVGAADKYKAVCHSCRYIFLADKK